MVVGAMRSDRRPAVAGVAGGLGFGLLSVGVGLATYSRFFAPTRSLDGTVAGHDLFGSFTTTEASDLVNRYATLSFILGVLVLIAAIAAAGVRAGRWRLNILVELYILLAFAAGIVVIPIMAVRDHLPGLFLQIRWQFGLFTQLPTAVAAATLVVLGSVLLADIAWRPERMRALSRRAAGAAALVGILVAATVSTAAFYAGDDSTRWDHTTAAPVDVPPVPARLGDEIYHFDIPHDSSDIVAAGAGFVVATVTGLTAYDGATGAPRWHLLRTHRPADRYHSPAYGSGSLHAIDDGKTVVAEWKNVGWIALDAMTGKILWQIEDYTPIARSAKKHPRYRIALAEEIVEASEPSWKEAYREIRAWNRTDGRPTATHRHVPTGTYCSTRIVAAPGAVVVSCLGLRNSQLVGYGD
ncbi:PQQ-binding-like beta-propeller repeat protein [Nocardia terpenica]|uniref:PQQ-binding-like beta-propeller repeat protein n=2 Tax=Nocardia terpenica TaxID=455432 RepID=A0A6G9ZBQ9_9NOCA|nr:PQQ-binding-like beta-propeller repeat protein [Nocardia terpenica]